MRLTQKIKLLLIPIAFLAMVVSGCRPSCDSIPFESLPNVRILNAVSNSNLLLVYIDGKLFDSCWYEIESKYGQNWNPKHPFDYRTTFLPNDSSLRSGLHHLAAMDATSRDTIVAWNGQLRELHQTLIFLGKTNGTAVQTPHVIYLDDATRSPDVAHTYLRFVDAVVDVPGLDVDFSNRVSSKPNLRLGYATISDAQGGDGGTGFSANDYFTVPTLDTGLLILPEGDTIASDNLFNFPYSSVAIPGFVGTVVVRGESHPAGTDPLASTIVLEDIGAGTAAFYVESFNVRIVNASNFDSITLMVQSLANGDIGPRYNLPSWNGVVNIGLDSVSTYVPMNPVSYGNAQFWFAAGNPSLTDTVYPFHRTHVANERSTYIAIDTIPHDAGTSGISLFELDDTVSNPTDTAMGRVRFVNASADDTVSFTFAGQSYTLPQRGIGYGDAQTGNYSISVNGAVVSFPVQNIRPTTVFFMPPTPGNPVPYRISTQ